MERISTGNAAADLILDGGFPRASINILMGLPGTGKTLLAQQMAFANVGHGRPALYLSTLSEPLAKLVTYLQGYRFADPSRIGTDILYEDLAADLADAPEKLPARMLALIQQYRPGLIVIDSFKALSDLMPDLATWRRVLFELAGLLSAYDTTSFWVGEYTTESIGRLPEFAVADGIVELTREQTGSRDGRYVRIVKLRGSGFLDGIHAFDITAEGLDIQPRLVSPRSAADYTVSPERLRSGIAGFDGMIENDLLRGTYTLVLGPSGAGKTIMGLHFLREGASLGEPGLLVGFQESPVQLARAMRNFGWTPEDLLAPGKFDLFYTSPVEMQIDAIVREIFRRIEAGGVKRVVIDAVADMERSARDPLRFRDYLYALGQHLAARNITTLFLLEATGNEHPAGAISDRQVAYLSDNIVWLEMHLEDELKRTIRVIKARGSAHSSYRHDVRITAQGLVVEAGSRAVPSLP
jgi:circadian clock protein KaiC